MRTSKVVLKILNICVSILILILLVMGLVKLGNTSYDMGYRIFSEQPMTSAPGRDVVVEVSSGMSAFALGKLLEEKGLVDSAFLFMIQMKLSAYSNDVNPGTYTLNTSQTVHEMLVIMSAESQIKETTE